MFNSFVTRKTLVCLILYFASYFIIGIFQIVVTSLSGHYTFGIIFYSIVYLILSLSWILYFFLSRDSKTKHIILLCILLISTSLFLLLFSSFEFIPIIYKTFNSIKYYSSIIGSQSALSNGIIASTIFSVLAIDNLIVIFIIGIRLKSYKKMSMADKCPGNA